MNLRMICIQVCRCTCVQNNVSCVYAGVCTCVRTCLCVYMDARMYLYTYT